MNVTLQNRTLPKVEAVVLRRVPDGCVFRICASRILKLPTGLVHVTGKPQEELDTGIWDITQKFIVLEIQRDPSHYIYRGL